MNAVAPIARPSIPCTRPPELPCELRRLVNIATISHWSEGSASHAKAAQYAEVWRRRVEPPDPDLVEQWAMLLIAGHPNAPGPEMLEGWIALLIAASLHLSAECFTYTTLGMVAKASKYWPSVGDVGELLQPVHDRLVAELQALDRIAAARPWQKALKSSTVLYPPQPLPAWVGNRVPRHCRAYDDPEPPVNVDAANVRQQLAALGYPKGVPQPAKAEAKPFDSLVVDAAYRAAGKSNPRKPRSPPGHCGGH